MGKYQPSKQGSVRVRPGKRTFWLARPSTFSVGLGMVAVVVVGLSAMAVGVPIGPWVWYHLKPSMTRQLATLLRQPVAVAQDLPVVRTYDDWVPQQEASLSAKNQVLIPAIKVKTPVIEALPNEFERALQQGVWRVPDFGTPDSRRLPTILVAHRFGYVAWTNQYRREHSFFNLPKLQLGDRVEMIWNQRRYIYEVYAGDEGTQISDYSADLILYTCQYLQSDQRIFKYARLVEN